MGMTYAEFFVCKSISANIFFLFAHPSMPFFNDTREA